MFKVLIYIVIDPANFAIFSDVAAVMCVKLTFVKLVLCAVWQYEVCWLNDSGRSTIVVVCSRLINAFRRLLVARVCAGSLPQHAWGPRQ